MYRGHSGKPEIMRFQRDHFKTDCADIVTEGKTARFLVFQELQENY